MMNVDWLNKVEIAFNESGILYGDFFYIFSSAITEGVISFPSLLKDASEGVGVYAREGLAYSLDQDWDDPSLFDGVACFVGDVETSIINISDFLRLISIVVDIYILEFPDDKEKVCLSMERLKERYSSAPAPSNCPDKETGGSEG